MQAHAHDLRVEVAQEPDADCWADLDALVHQFVDDWTRCPLDARTTALLHFAEKLTRTPAAIGAGDVETLRGAGWNDRAIHDATQVIAYFNYINRIADGLGVEPEPGLSRWGRGTMRSS